MWVRPRASEALTGATSVFMSPAAMQQAGQGIRVALLGCYLSAVAACVDSGPAGDASRQPGTPAGLRAGWHSPTEPVRPPAPPTAPGPTAPSDAADAMAAAAAEEWDLAIQADPDVGRAPLTVEFTAILDVERVQPTRMLWDFGDGERAEGTAVRHVYRAAGEYTAMLRVVASDGRSAVRDVILQVDDAEADRGDP